MEYRYIPRIRCQTCLLPGTLDALFADTEADTVSTVRQMFAEISRVLKFGGRYLCLTLAQDFIAEELVNWFYQDKGWILRIQRVFDMEQGEAELVVVVVRLYIR